MRARTLRIAVAALAALSVAATVDPLHLFDQHALEQHDHKLLLGEFSKLLPAEPVYDAPCVDGLAHDLWACDGVDLLAYVPIGQMDASQHNNLIGTTKVEGSDVWGWTSPDTGDDYVVFGKTNGAAFFRITDPSRPVYLGDLPNPSPAYAIWHDIKVYADHAFIVSESDVHGMQVFDLRRLDGVTSPRTWTSDTDYLLQSFTQHNVAIDTDTGFAYIVGGGTSPLDQRCGSGLHMVDVHDPSLPAYAGCYKGDGYVHDTQCVVYDGPDREHAGREICLNSSETELSIVDVTDKSAPAVLSRAVYDGVAYTHQGWLTEDHRFFLLGDEGDERATGDNTRTIVFDLADLDDVADGTPYVHGTTAVDHNLYVLDGLVYESNYAAGLRVLSTAGLYADPADPQDLLEEVAFFDVFPDHDRNSFVGTWSNYPYFGDGIVVVSGYDGLFVLRVRDDVLAQHAFDPRLG